MNTPHPAKLAMRDQLLTARGKLPVGEIAARAHRLCAVVMASELLHRAATIALYVSVGREPGTGPLLDALHEAGKRVILPVLQPDNDLDWAVYGGGATLVSASRGMLEPTSARLGIESITGADLVFAPALAVTRSGHRLGRGGGSYDRALARATGITIALVNREEVLNHIPIEPHDQTVHGYATPEGIHRCIA